MQVEDDVITVGGRPWNWQFELSGDAGVVEVAIAYRNGDGKVDMHSVQTLEIDAMDALRLVDALRQAVLRAGRVTW